MPRLNIIYPIVLIAVLSGCAADTSTFTSGSAPREISLNESDPDGVLIVGNPRRFIGGVHTLVFHSYDPNRKLLISPTKGGQIFRISNGGVLIHNVDVVDGIQYLLQKIPAGHYYLAEVQWGAYARTTMPSGSIAAEVKPGTVNYVGNLVFKTPFSAFGEVGIKLNGRNDIAARSFLANYAQIKPEMQNASPRIFKLNCMLEDGVEACYAP